MILIANSKFRPIIVGPANVPLFTTPNKRQRKQNYDCPFTSMQMHCAFFVASKQRNGLYKVLKAKKLPKGLITQKTLKKYIDETLAEKY